MKKLTTFALIVIALFSGVLFSACGDKYKNLKMKFVYTDGEEIEKVVLFKDSNKPELATERIGVKFSGIDEDDIGQVVVYSSPSELFTTSNVVYSGNYYYFDITATRAATGKLIVKHLSSDKTQKIDLVIEQKSTDLIATSKKYVVAVNDVTEGETRTHMLKTKELVNLIPSSSTDKVYFKEVVGSNTLPAGVRKLTETIDGETYIVGFEILNSAVEQNAGAHYKLIPVTKMQGYDDKSYDDAFHNDYEVVEIFFENVLNNENVIIDTDEKHKDEDGKIYETIYLIANDTSADVSENYNYNNVLFDLKTNDEAKLGQLADYLDDYAITIVENSSAIQSTHAGNGKFVVQATAYTEENVTIQFVLTPKNLIGDVAEISKTVVVKGEVRSDTIQAKKNNEIIDTNEIVDIYNYIHSGNSNGLKFNFEAIAKSDISVYHELNLLRLEIVPEILYLDVDGGYYTNILDADGEQVPSSATVIGDFVSGERYLANQKNLVRIFRGNDYLQFTYNKVTNKFVSAPFMSFSELYIKYVETASANDDVALQMDVTAGYEGEFSYLKNIEKTTITLKFDTKEGVSALNVFAGSFKNVSGTIVHSPEQNADATYIAAENIYINKDIIVTDRTKDEHNEYELIFTKDSVFGIDGKQLLSDISLQIEITYTAAHISKPLLISGALKYNLEIDSLATDFYVPLDILPGEEGTSVGTYTITFKQEDTGFEKNINCYIYKELNQDNVDEYLSLDFANNDLDNEAFKNFYIEDGEKKYTYADYQADYIVYVGKELNLSANINQEVLDSNIVKSYSYNSYMMNSAHEETAELSWNNYFDFDKSQDLPHFTKLSFINNGLINNGNIYYIAYEIEVASKKFDSILEEDVSNSTTSKITLTFFVYERIVDGDQVKASINYPVLEKYMKDYIGYNNASESMADLSVVMDDDKLWNYVQKQAGKANNVVWKHSFGDTTTIVTFDNQEDKSITATFKKNGEVDSYNCYILAEVRQFNKIISLRSEVLVRKPILTEELRLTNALPKFVKMSSNSYFSNAIFEYNLDMRVGDEFAVSAEHISPLGDVTHKGISLVVANAQGSTIQDAVRIVDNKIIVDRIQPGLRLIVYSTDVLRANVADYVSGFKLPEGYIMEGEEGKDNVYKKAYFIINLHLEDGSTKETAYRVYNLTDFEEMLESSEEDKWYQIMNDINLSKLSVFNKEFDGHIYSDYGCMLYNLKLNSSNKNLFKSLNGSMENLKIEVAYNYSLSGEQTSRENLGIIGNLQIGATIQNVQTTISGKAIFSKETHQYDFGLIVGVNNGSILYDKDYCGVNGSIILDGKADINFGGIAGVNNGIIKGANINETDLNSTTNNIQFTSASGTQGAVANITINANDLEMTEGGLGGIIGKNCGQLLNVYVTGVINAQKVNNVGGAIGYATTTETGKYERDNSTISYNAEEIAEVEHVKSNVVIIAKDNVGGIVGYDAYGLYKKCWYQILPTTSIGISANNSVGGIIGNSMHSKLQFCSVFSYKYDYTNQTKYFADLLSKQTDILGVKNVAGLIGYVAETSLNTGSTDITNSTIIRNSSVNAKVSIKDYVSGAENQVAGIYTANAKVDNSYVNGIIHSSYFIGQLMGYYVTTDNMCLDNAGQSANYNAYSLNFNGASFVEGATSGFDIESIASPYWNKDDSLNLGYIYVSSSDDEDENKPIFDLVPNSFEVKSKLDSSKNINVYYYDFSTSGETEEKIKLLNQYFNQVKITDLLEFEFAPGGKIAVAVKSSDTNVIDIIGDELVVIGLGEATLTFNPVLNVNLVQEIHVTVADNLTNLVVTQDGRTPIGKLEIAKKQTKQIQTYSLGSVDATGIVGLGNSYSYKSTNQYGLMVSISWQDAAKTGDYYLANAKISHYITINNGIIKENSADSTTELKVYLPYGTPLSFTANNVGGEFKVEVLPHIDENNAYTDVEPSRFDLITCQGASKIALSYNSAIVYPNDITMIEAKITTDIELGATEINALLYSVILEENAQIISDYISLYETKTFDADKNQQIVVFKVSIDSRFEFVEDPSQLKINFKTEYSPIETVEYTILPQRIDKIEAKGYVYYIEEGKTFADAEIVSSNVLKPNQLGLLVIDVSPTNGYYDYLEIDDVTGNEEIKFVQLEDVTGDSLFEVDTPSTLGKGIKLVKVDGKSSIYLTMQIDKNFTSKMHTLRITAHYKDGTVLKTDYKQVDVKMLPIINVEHQLPNGESKHYESNNAGVEEIVDKLYFANGTSAQFRITTKNTTEPLDYSVSGSYSGIFELVNTHGDFYILNNKEINNNDINEEISIKLQATSILNNNIETAKLTLKFKIVPYVIHSVSLTSTNAKGEVYGNFGVVTELDAYFKATDITYYNNGTYNDVAYSYDSSMQDIVSADSYEVKVRKSINNILKELNTNAEDNYMIVNEGVNNGYTRSVTDVDAGENELTKRYKALTGDGSDKIELYFNPATNPNINTMIVKNGYPENAHLALDMEIVYNNTNKIWEVQSNVTASGDGKDESIDVSKNYKLNFNKPFEEDDYLLIKNVEDFLAMEDGEQNRYILGNDLVLTDYSPIDVKIAEFDGNGRTIRIKSFATFSEEVINAGLFKQIYPNMLVKNVNVVYETSRVDTVYSFGKVTPKSSASGVVDFKVDEYADLCNDYTVNYTQAVFGGLTPLNNGIVTNCTVNGQIALRASTVELNKKASTGGNYEIAFNIGGLVGENTKTGYITNSTSGLKIFALANIGGLVYSNEGKIASSSVEEDAVIYSYNINLEKTILVEVGGFVSQNSGSISMSHTTLNYYYRYDEGARIHYYKGLMSTKDESAGFVYENSGDIKNCYVQISQIGNNNNIFCGFVYSNKGSIANSYTSINQGVDAGANTYMFVGPGADNLVDCLEFVKITSDYTINSSVGLTTVDYNKIFGDTAGVKEVFKNHNYIFGNDSSAVWTMKDSSLPLLVSCEDKVRYTGGQASSGINYYGLRNFIYDKTEVKNPDGSTTLEWKVEFVQDTYGKSSNPYIIATLDNWNSRLYDNTSGYYRIVADIVFSEFSNPNTSKIAFSGNIQGNDMVLSNIKLYLQEDVEAVGLFKTLQTMDDIRIDNSVRNLTLKTTSGWAAKADAFGVLSGKAIGFNLYNITVDSSNVTIVGGNAVGGVVGYVGGEFDIDGISSNIGVNSTRELSSYKHSIYVGRNNKLDSNLQSVYYAGSVFGIVDGYNKSLYDINDVRNLEDKYYQVKNIKVTDGPIVIGDTVGAAFGFVGERVKATNVNVNLQSPQFKGYQYSGGLAGENRGVIQNASVVISGECYAETNYAAAGVVGLNIGGLVRNVNVNVQIVTTGNTVVGGVVARNINGFVSDVKFEGVVQSGNITGVIMATNYSKETFASNTGASAITNSSNLNLVVPNGSTFTYKENNEPIGFSNLVISESALKHLMDNISSFYTYAKYESESVDSLIQNNFRAFGLLVGMTDKVDSLVEYVYYDNGKQIILNNATKPSNFEEKEVYVNLLPGEALIKLETNKYYIKEDGSFGLVSGGSVDKIKTFNKKLDYVYTIYITGAKVETFDNWDRSSFSEDFVVFGNFNPPDED